MSRVDYFAIIHRYISPNSLTYRFYLPHVASVTAMAIRVGRRLGLEPSQLQFIEEASMLHDIGIVNVDAEHLGCYGDLPYVAHLEEGRRILEAEGLSSHAEIACNHVGLGVTREEVIAKGLALPPRDIFPGTLEAQIVSWADLFFSKLPDTLWQQRSVEDVRARVARYGSQQQQTFEHWLECFGL
jgi:uncharacterized protein